MKYRYTSFNGIVYFNSEYSLKEEFPAAKLYFEDDVFKIINFASEDYLNFKTEPVKSNCGSVRKSNKKNQLSLF
jgi:hypothetical protein